MITFDRIVITAILIWVFLRTSSFGIWTWKKKNKLGALMVFVVALSALGLPIYAVFFKH